MIDYYRQAKLILLNIGKTAQQNDLELSSPEVKVEPADEYLTKAIALVKSTNPNYFVGVRKIVVDMGSSAYGYVGGTGNDPAVIHINLSKIKNELNSKMSGASKEQFDKELVRQIASTLAHEAGHIKSYKPESGFQGGESPAESAEQQMLSKLDANPNR